MLATVTPAQWPGLIDERDMALVQIAHGGDKSGALERRELVAQVGDGVDDFHACDLTLQFKKGDYTSVEAPSSPTRDAEPASPGRRRSAPFLRARGSVPPQIR